MLLWDGLIMQQEKNNVLSIIVSSVSTAILTFICFVLLGTFYTATEHSIGTNIFVWIITVVVAYFIYYGFHWLVKIIFKKISSPKLYNMWAIISVLIFITLVCLFRSENVDDYLYVEIMGLISGVAGTLEIIHSFKRKNN